ncbi:MAG: SIS domain-containing protein [Gemmatimonadetes bacterium]|nr:SIS domain-containing protein [Gemmatimonadota bacterium]
MSRDDAVQAGRPRAEAVRTHLRSLADTARAAEALVDDVARAGAWIVDTLESGGTLYFCGNGGSAADAQHLAAEYVVRFTRERRALPAVALTVDTSVLTAAGNDFGFDEVFARQVAALGRPGDLLILHSTSGRSPNLLRAAQVAKSGGLRTVAFLARDGGSLRSLVDLAIVVPTDVTAHAQEVHLALGHAVCDEVDRLYVEIDRPRDTPSGGVE